MKISEAFNQYKLEVIILGGMSDKTSRNYTTVCNSFINAVGDVPIVLINDGYLITWKTYMVNRGNAPSSISSSLCIFRNVIKFASEKGCEVIDHRDIKLPKLKPKAPNYVVNEDVKKMLNSTTNERDRALIVCLYSTGCRISEILDLTRDDYSGDEIMVTGKNGGYRPVYLSSEARIYLDAYLRTRKDSLKPLFISSQRRRITVSRVGQILHELADKAGIEKNVHPHAFRHGFATDLMRNGADLRSVQSMLGHKNIQTTQIYTHVTNHHLKKIHKEFHSRI